MASQFVKDLLQSGTYHPAGREEITFTDADIAQMLTNGRAMLSHKINVPVSWDHEPTAKPRTPSELAAHRAKNTLGSITDFRFAPDGRLEVLTSVDDAADAKQVAKTKFVSPGLQQNFRDGAGRVYPGWSVIHAAVTPRPINADQRPFAALSAEGAGRVVCLSLAELEPVKMAKKKVNLAADEDPPVEHEGDANTDETPPPETEEEVKAVEESSAFQSAVEALAKVGLALSPDVTPESFFDHILTAVETKMAAEGIGPNGDDSEPPDDATPPEGHGAGGMGMVGMSHDAAIKRLLKHEAEGLSRRIDRLLKTRRIPGTVHRGLISESKTVKLSFGDDGDLAPNALLLKIGAYEALPEGQAFPGRTKSITGGAKGDVNLGHADVSTMPRDLRGKPESPAEVDAAVESFFATK